MQPKFIDVTYEKWLLCRCVLGRIPNVSRIVNEKGFNLCYLKESSKNFLKLSIQLSLNKGRVYLSAKSTKPLWLRKHSFRILHMIVLSNFPFWKFSQFLSFSTLCFSDFLLSCFTLKQQVVKREVIFKGLCFLENRGEWEKEQENKIMFVSSKMKCIYVEIPISVFLTALKSFGCKEVPF